MKASITILMTLALLLPTGCDSRPDSWDAWVYPDKSNMDVSYSLVGFKTFEDCQQAATDKLRSLKDPDEGDYECGHRCRFDPSMGDNVCKEIQK